MNDNVNELCQRIAEQAAAQVPERWSKLQIRAELDDEVSLYDAWYLSKEGQRHMLEVNFELSDSFEKLRNLDALSKQGKWGVCTFELSASGVYKSDYLYDENPRWVEKGI